jgi:pilus assembly protein CpaB
MLMPRRLLAATAAVLLAVLGAVFVISYAHGADARARAGEQLVPVLVVDSTVQAGTAVTALGDAVSVQQVPRRLAVQGSVSGLSSLGGKVTTTELLPGQQVSSAYFSDPAALRPPGTAAVPPGMVEVSVSLESERAVGGVLKAGDRIGVQLTDPSSSGSVSALKPYRILHDVLVTRVAGPATGAAAGDAGAVSTVTLALLPDDASDVVLGATAKAIWLTLEKAAVGSSSAGSGSGGSTTTSFTTNSTSGGSK